MTRKQRMVVLVLGVLSLMAVGGAGMLLWSLSRPLVPLVLPTPTSFPWPVVPAVPLPDVYLPERIYWPKQVEPLDTTQAPNGLLWWNMWYRFRRRIVLDQIAAEAPVGSWGKVLIPGGRLVDEEKLLPDGKDLRVLYWDGRWWWELPRIVYQEGAIWSVYFPLQGAEAARAGGYALYYGYLAAPDPPAVPASDPAPWFLLESQDEEAVEWAAETTWSPQVGTEQQLVSPDGRLVVICPPDCVKEEPVRVRLRIVPAEDALDNAPLPRYEFHADPPPHAEDPVPHWDVPLTIRINWAGLPATSDYIRHYTHFSYEIKTGRWLPDPAESDLERGITVITTHQP